MALPTSAVLWYVTPAAGVIAALALSGLPLAAGAAILRYRLYDIDLFISRTVAYASLTVLLISAYAVMTVALGAFLGRGSAWTAAVATLVCAMLFRPLRGRIQDAVDRRFNRARYDALHRMAGFLEDVRAGRRPPEDVQTVLREILGDSSLDLLVFLPESRRYVDLAGQARADTDGRHRIAIERGDQPIGVVLHGRVVGPDLLRKVVEDGGLAVEIARLRAELNVQLVRGEGIPGAHRRRRARRTPQDRARPARRRAAAAGVHRARASARAAPARLAPHRPTYGSTLDGAIAEATVAIGELRELAHGLPPAQLDAGLAPACQELARRAPLPVSVRHARATLRHRRRGRGVLHLL